MWLSTWKDLATAGNHVPTHPWVLLALVSLSLLWGWPEMALVLLLLWGALLRPEEGRSLHFYDLVFSDVIWAPLSLLFLRIGTPKMRRLRAAREHARVDEPLTVNFARAQASLHSPQELLFADGPVLFRRRHDDLVQFFGISTRDGIGCTPASHRPGRASML